MNSPKTVLICGDADSVFEDFEKTCALHTPDGVIAINEVFTKIEHVDFFCTDHPEKAMGWLDKRREKGFKDPFSYWTATNKALPVTPVFQTVPNTFGGSALLAVSVARYLGYQKLILAGVPLELDNYRHVWERNTSLKTDIRSFSGWTAEHFGRPTTEWLMF